MNIFAVSPNPIECAQALDDKRLVKMCTETAQILSSALRLNGVENDRLYKLAFPNHPIVQWARTPVEMEWTRRLHFELFHEYFQRFKIPHKSDELWLIFFATISDIRKVPKQFCNCARNEALSLDYTDISDVHASYRAYLCARWALDKRIPRWTNRKPPEWSPWS